MSQEIQTRLVVQVQPNANHDDVTSFVDGILHLKVAAPPVKGKANKELIKFLSRLLGVSEGRLIIEKGITNRRKVIAVKGLTQADALEHLRLSLKSRSVDSDEQ